MSRYCPLCGFSMESAALRCPRCGLVLDVKVERSGIKEEMLKLVEKLIKSSELFKGMEIHEVAQIISRAKVKVFNRGDELVKKGECGKDIYVILSGEAEVLLSEGKEISPVILKPGDCVGEMAAMDSMPRSATVVASTDKLYVFFIPFESISCLDPSISSKLFRNIARIVSLRLRRARKKLEEVLEKE